MTLLKLLSITETRYLRQLYSVSDPGEHLHCSREHTRVYCVGDRPLTDLYEARDAGKGGPFAQVSFWGPTILTTNNNITPAFAQADRSPIGHDP